MPNQNSASTPECWGKSELLKRLLLAGKMGSVEAVPKKGRPRCGPKFSDQEIEQNLWSRVRVAENGCWNFQGCVVGKYKQARFTFKKEQIASRISWIFTRGQIPDGLFVLHHCDNEQCVRTDHLFLGDHLANTADKMKKNRQWRPIGTLNQAAILNEEKVREIRRLRTTGLFEREIGEIIGCARSAVSGVLQGKSWSHVK